MKVREAMTAVPVTIRPEDTGDAAAVCMARHRVRHLPVVDDRGTLQGVVTDRDLRHYLLSPAAIGELGQVPVSVILAKTAVRDIMAWPVLVTTPETDLAEAVALMRERRIGSLAVVHERRLLGIVTETDLLRRVMALDVRRREARGTGDDGDIVDVVVSYP